MNTLFRPPRISGWISRARILPLVLLITTSVASFHSSMTHAHPHAWINVQLAVVIEAGSIVAFRHSWTFDRNYLANTLAEYDRDHDGTLSAVELIPFLTASKKTLREFNSFTVAKQGYETIELVLQDELQMEQSEHGLKMQFTVRLKKPLAAVGSNVSLEVYDPTFFSQFAFAESEPAVFDASVPINCQAKLILEPYGKQQKQIAEYKRQIGGATSGIAPAKALKIACLN